MGRAEVSHQGFAGFVLQVFKIGGLNAQPITGSHRLQTPRLITEQLKLNVLHVYFLVPAKSLGGFCSSGW